MPTATFGKTLNIDMRWTSNKAMVPRQQLAAAGRQAEALAFLINLLGATSPALDAPTRALLRGDADKLALALADRVQCMLPVPRETSGVVEVNLASGRAS
jgi:hypothetical protein